MVSASIRKHPAALCEECPLALKPCAPSLIPPRPVAAVVARSPGWKEAKTGEPFTGLSGKVLNHLLAQNGIKREEVLLTNVVLCAPDEGKVPPEAIKACAPRLEQELHDVSLIIAAGSEAVNLLVGRGSIDRYRGYRINRNGRTLIATNNPALVLRDDSTFPNLRKDFKRAFNPLPPPVYPGIEVIEDVEAIQKKLHDLCDYRGAIAVDTETRGGLTQRATLVSVQLSLEGSHAIVFGERDQGWQNSSVIGSLARLLQKSQGRVFIYHNGKFDVKILRYSYGIDARIDHDTMLMSYVLDERSGQSEKQHGGYHKLEYLMAEEFGWEDYEPQSVKDFKKDGVVRDYDELYEYAGRDVAGTYQLFELLTERLESEMRE